MYKNNYGNNNKNKDRFKAKPPKVYDYLIYGKHPCLLALKNPKRVVEKIFVTKNSEFFLKENLLQEFDKFQDRIEITDAKQLSKLFKAQDISHQGIAIKTDLLEQPSEEEYLKYKKIIILDQISDPHNIGAIIRNSAAFNFDAVITEEKNSPPENVTITKTSAGIFEKIPYIRVRSLGDTLSKYKENGLTVIGLDGHQDDDAKIYKNPNGYAVIVGSEGKGMRPHIKRLCDNYYSIDISSEVESLNASVACGIALNMINSLND